MAADERDRNFEKALARQLRPGAESENSAGLPRAGEAVCPDMEILAAYHERSLAQDELISWKTHIAGCSRCQELLAQLELTDEIPADAQLAAMQQSIVSEEGGTASSGGAIAPSLAPNTKVQTMPPARKTMLRWVAPAGAIAAGLLVWIVVRENKSFTLPSQQQVQVAKSEPAPSATPAPFVREEMKLDKASPQMKIPAGAAKEKDSFAVGSADANLPAQGRNRQDLRLSQQRGAVAGGTLPASGDNAILDGTRGERALPKSEISQGGGSQQNAGMPSEREQMVAEPAAPPPPSPAQAQSTLSPAKPAKSAGAAGDTLQNQVGVARESREYSDIQAFKKVSGVAATHDPRLAAVPGGNVVWRVGLGGIIEKSGDSGKTFSRQESGTKSELVAASAPSELACWVVGDSGTILRTVDGGGHWSKLDSPVQTNVGGVRATDGMHATIWDIANSTFFTTSDGGMTWTLVPNE